MSTMVEVKLKPCPFCGCTNIYIGRGGIECPVSDACGTWGYVAGCKNKKCGALVHGPGLPKDYHKRPGAIAEHKHQAIVETAALWNRRPDDLS